MPLTYKNIELVEEGDFVYLLVQGKLETSDYDFFVPEVDQQIAKYGTINMLVELKDFHGWSAGAAWEDTKFGLRHFNDMKRLAIMGDKGWEKGIALFAKFFTMAKVKFFEINQKKEAISWLNT